MSKLKNKEAKTRREMYDNEDDFFGILYTHEMRTRIISTVNRKCT